MEKEPTPHPSWRAYAVLAGLALMLASSFYLFRWKKPELPPSQQQAQQESFPEPEEPAPGESIGEEPPAPSIPQFPTDTLFITAGRQDYQAESMRLIIPKLNLDLPVQNGVDEETLKKGPGLYDYAQLPTEGNSNVSIAGHRDIYGSPFYYVDTLASGDLFYLSYNGKVYRYAYYSTEVVGDEDWSPIYCKEVSALTLTSCTPIGTSLKRIIITAKLLDVTRLDPTEEYAYQANDPAYSSLAIGLSGTEAP